MKLTASQQMVLIDAYKSGGLIYWTSKESSRHSIQVIHALKRKGLLEQCRNWVAWKLTDQGREALKGIY